MRSCPPFGTVYFSTTVAVDAFGRHGATHDLAQRGVGRSGRESVMGNRSVLSECHWSTRMGVRGHGFRGVGTVHYLCRECVLSLSIARPRSWAQVRSRSHYRVSVEMEDKPANNLCDN